MPRPAVVGELNRSSRRQCGTSSSADGKWAASAIEQGMIPFGYRIALVHPIIKAFRQQRRLLAIRPLNETLHHPTPIQQGNHSIGGVFTQPGSKPEKLNESKCFPLFTQQRTSPRYFFVPIADYKRSGLARVPARHRPAFQFSIELLRTTVRFGATNNSRPQTARFIGAVRVMPRSDQETVLHALEYARRIVGKCIAGQRDATRMVERLLTVLDEVEIVDALDRMKRRRILRLID